MTKIFWFIRIVPLLLLLSCTGGPSPGGSGSLLPNITGSAGEVLIVMDTTRWKEKPGLLLKEMLEQEFPALPQPEPLFDIINIAPGAFDEIFKRHRSIIIVDIGSENTIPEIRYHENIWSKPQLVIRIMAANSESLVNLLTTSEEQILLNLQSYDRKRLINIFKSSIDPGITSIVNKFHINLAIPRGYRTDVNTDEFAMFSIESPGTSQSVFIYRSPFTGDDDLSSERIINRRNEMLKKYTRGSQIGSYIITSPAFPPVIYDLKKNGKQIVEIRGWWELNRGFMGGPFLSHTIVDGKHNQTVTVDAYVYNPQDKKRNLMRHMEAIVYSTELIE